MSQTKLLQLARSTSDVAKKAGAKDARVKISRSREVSVEWRDGKLDRVQESTKQGLSIALFVDGRYSGNSTSDLREQAIEDFVKKSVAATRYLAPDEHRKLPDPSRYEGMTKADLGIFDGSIGSISPESRLASAKKLEEAARAGEGSDRIISVETSMSDDQYEVVCLNTNGLEAEEQGTSVWQAVSISVRDEGDRKPRGSSYGGGTYLNLLPEYSFLGKDALERALSQIGSKQIETGRYEVIVENRAAPTLSGHIFSPLSGSALQQKRSFFDGKLEARVAADTLSILSDPHLVHGLSSTAWDSEGMATKPRAVFEKGVLKNYFLDTYYASKLGMEPTTGSMSNLVWRPGERDAAAMIKDIKRGLFITSFLGGNSNSVTGDFSLGVKGYLIENGELGHPISEMNMAANHLQLWNNLVEVGNDPYIYSSNRTPSLRFKDVQCSGA